MKANRLFLALLAMLASCCLAQAQSTAATPNPQESTEATASPKLLNRKPKTTNAPAPLTLKNVRPASTESAAASAARDLVERKADSPGAAREKNGRPETAIGSNAVAEFQAVSPGARAGKGSGTSNGGGHERVGRVHGELYGAAGNGGDAAAGSVGVTSKDRKTSVYVGGDQTRSEPSQSH